MTNEAIKCCFFCPVRIECADYRERTDSEYGIWAAQVVNPESLKDQE